MIIFLNFSLITSRAIKNGGGENLKNYAVFVYYKLESKYKNLKNLKMSWFKIEKIMPDFIWIESAGV
jgi:hypothetical protein